MLSAEQKILEQQQPEKHGASLFLEIYAEILCGARRAQCEALNPRLYLLDRYPKVYLLV